jgi:uncharacterized protein (TIGR03067 family)
MTPEPRPPSLSDPLDPLACLEELWDEPACTASLSRDVAGLQGTWLFVEGRRKAELYVCGNHLTVHFADGDIYMGTFILNGDGIVGSIDVLIEEGPTRHRGRIALGIYEVQGDTLYWCTASPGPLDRPLSFHETTPDLLSMVFRRDPIVGRR